MGQRIILIHGRSTKPAQDKHKALLERALLQGLQRSDPAKAEKVKNGDVPVDYVYYGDVNNEILALSSDDIDRSLTDRDPKHQNRKSLPDTGYAQAIDDMLEFRNFSRREYRRVLSNNDSMNWRDNLARLASTFSALATATLLNEAVIKYATADLGAYLMRRTIGSKIRERLHTPLRKALLNDEDVCLVAHSMGTMVAYDVLWKFSRMSEYQDIQDKKNPVTLFLTLGAPLGEAGVKANLYDANERSHKLLDPQTGKYRWETDKFPRNIIKMWHNVAAHDDFISHDPSLRDDFGDMIKFGLVENIKDHRIHNCWSFRGKANPHKFYGYLVHPKTAGFITDWIV